MELCFASVEARIGQKREDIPWVEEEFDEEFRQWIMDFPTDQLPYIYKLTEEYKNTKDIHIFRSRKETDQYLKKLKIQIS